MPYVLALGDILAFFLAFYLARISHALYYQQNLLHVLLHWWGSQAEINILLFLLLTVLGVIAFAAKGHYTQRRAFWDEVGDMVAVFTLLIVLDAAIAFLGKWPLSRLWLFSTWVLALLFLPMIRLLLRLILIRLGVWSQSIVVIGSGRNAVEAIRALANEPLLGYSVECVLVPDGLTPATKDFPIPTTFKELGSDPLETLRGLGNPHVLLALDMEQWGEQERLVRTLGLHYPELTIAPPLRGLPLFGLEVMHFFSQEVFMLRVRDNLAQLGPRISKRIFDLVAASILIALFSPLLLFIAWRIRVADGGKIFYAQTRIGKDGKPFPCFKFRTMVMDAEARLQDYLAKYPELREEYERSYKLRDDPRVTRIGKFLRRTSLDELPQLFNVLRGEMSLVGPRPVTQKELEEYYGDIAKIYRLVHPGITGLWQVSGRSDTTYSERTFLDAWYIKNWSLWYDIVILLRTIKVVLRREGAY